MSIEPERWLRTTTIDFDAAACLLLMTGAEGSAMRNEMIGAVVRRAIENPEFRRKLVESPGETLETHGFALESNEMAEIEKIRTRLGGEDAEQQLISIAETYGVDPRAGE